MLTTSMGAEQRSKKEEAVWQKHVKRTWHIWGYYRLGGVVKDTWWP